MPYIKELAGLGAWQKPEEVIPGYSRQHEAEGYGGKLGLAPAPLHTLSQGLANIGNVKQYQPNADEQKLLDLFKQRYGEDYASASTSGVQESPFQGRRAVQVNPDWIKSKAQYDANDFSSAGTHVRDLSKVTYDPDFGYITPGDNIGYAGKKGGVLNNKAQLSFLLAAGAIGAGAALAPAAGTGVSAGTTTSAIGSASSVGGGFGGGAGFAAGAAPSAAGGAASAGLSGPGPTFGDYSSLTNSGFGGETGLSVGGGNVGLTAPELAFNASGQLVPISQVGLQAGGQVAGSGASWIDRAKKAYDLYKKGNKASDLARQFGSASDGGSGGGDKYFGSTDAMPASFYGADELGDGDYGLPDIPEVTRAYSNDKPRLRDTGLR